MTGPPAHRGYIIVGSIRTSVFAMRASLSTKLAIIAILFLLGGLAFRAVGHDRLLTLSQVSSEVRDRWLDTVRVLGRLNGHIALLRTEEAEASFKADPANPA